MAFLGSTYEKKKKKKSFLERVEEFLILFEDS